MLATYAAWKSLEFGCISDRTPYTWIGLASDQIVASEDGKTKVPLRKDRVRLDAVRRKRAETDSPYDVLLSSLHLIISMRGTGYAFGPSVHTLSKTAYPAASFVRDNLVQYAWSHAAIVLCTSILTSPSKTLAAVISTAMPALSASAVSTVVATLSTAALGLGAYAGLQLGYTTFTLLVLIVSNLASFLPFSLPFLPPFNRREYHALFGTPYRLSSVSQFWSQDWHSFFARPFKVLGMDFPAAVIEGLGGSVALARAVGVMAVFALSGWLHEQGSFLLLISLIRLLIPSRQRSTRLQPTSHSSTRRSRLSCAGAAHSISSPTASRSSSSKHSPKARGGRSGARSGPCGRHSGSSAWATSSGGAGALSMPPRAAHY